MGNNILTSLNKGSSGGTLLLRTRASALNKVITRIGDGNELEVAPLNNVGTYGTRARGIEVCAHSNGVCRNTLRLYGTSVRIGNSFSAISHA